MDLEKQFKVLSINEYFEKHKGRTTVLWPWETTAWEGLIVPQISRKLTNPEELQDCLTIIGNGKIGSFFVQYFKKGDPKTEDFFSRVLPFIQSLALKLPTLFPEPVPIMVPNVASTLSFTREQAAGILAHAFFGTFIREWPTRVPKFRRNFIEISVHQT
eukprot:TRINITY_DN866_c0_g1_i8.p1 TRINITY_DN866_c0_g1~~TRINITY_DN866_c0_g1_i8.p1  ORF type:complete len:159 (-),score=38.87 TRINITY_DN866_c0_g1_i8:11-487(-)